MTKDNFYTALVFTTLAIVFTTIVLTPFAFVYQNNNLYLDAKKQYIDGKISTETYCKLEYCREIKP